MSAWGLPPSSGAWANQVDEEEAANGGELDPVPQAPTFPVLGKEIDQSFPSLGDSINVKESKREKRKKQGGAQKMSLGNFMAAGKEPEKLDLPTRPREREEGEEDRRGGLGGGFKNYGGDRGGFDRDDDGFRGREDAGPSRADAADDWGTKKAFVPSGPSRGGFGDRSGGFGGFKDRDSGGGGFSDRYTEKRGGFSEGGSAFRADDADKWASKTFEPSAPRRGGFESRDRESKYGGFGDDFGSKADTEDRWARRDGPSSQSSAPSSGSRPRLNLQPRSADLPTPALPPASTSSRASEASNDDKETALSYQPAARSGPRSNPFGNAKPVAVKEIPEKELAEKEKKEEAAQQETSEAKIEASQSPSPPVQANRPRSNPFGSARPREEVLKEKTTQQIPESENDQTEAPQGDSVQTPPQNSDTQEAIQSPSPQISTEQKSAESQPVNGADEIHQLKPSEQISEKDLQNAEAGTNEKPSQESESVVEKAKEAVGETVEKLSSALSRLTGKDKSGEPSKEVSKEAEASEEKSTTPVSESPKPTKSSEIRPGASWANIARGPANTPVEST